nr:hypothetical protein [Tanacetum cinerariifolium]
MLGRVLTEMELILEHTQQGIGYEVSKRKKNLLKQQYGNFKAEGSETLEQTFNRLQVIISQLQFMDVEVEKDDLNQKFLTILAPKWLMHTLVWRNRNDLDTMSLDDLYNHLKVYEAEVQKKSNPNSQNMAFISSSKHSSRDEDGNTACVPTASTIAPTASASVATISQDTASAYIASQSSGFQIKFEDINQIDKDDMEEMDIKWSMALLSMRADKFWKKTGKKISIQGSDVTGFDKSKVECFNYHKMGHFVRECRAPRREDHTLVADAEAPIEFALMANTESKRSDKVKDGVRYNVVSPPAADLYLSLKKDLSWTGLPEFVDDTVIDYSRPMPTIKSTSEEDQNKNSSTSEDVASPISPKPFVKPAGHRPHGPSMNPMRPNMNGARPNRSFFIQAHSYETRPFLKTLAVKTQYRAPWVPTVNMNTPLVNRKFSTGRRNFPTVNRKFPTASRIFTTGSTKIHTADMGRKGKAINPQLVGFGSLHRIYLTKGCTQNNINDKGYWDSGCSRHMTGNISYLSDFEPCDGGYATYPTFLILSHVMEDMCLLVKEDARLQAREPLKLIIMANPLPNNGVNLPEDEQVQPELIPALHGFAPAVLDIPNNNNGWIEEEPEEDLET